jgi:hypothetical protein
MPSNSLVPVRVRSLSTTSTPSLSRKSSTEEGPCSRTASDGDNKGGTSRSGPRHMRRQSSKLICHMDGCSAPVHNSCLCPLHLSMLNEGAAVLHPFKEDEDDDLEEKSKKGKDNRTSKDISIATTEIEEGFGAGLKIAPLENEDNIPEQPIEIKETKEEPRPSQSHVRLSEPPEVVDQMTYDNLNLGENKHLEMFFKSVGTQETVLFSDELFVRETSAQFLGEIATGTQAEDMFGPVKVAATRILKGK